MELRGFDSYTVTLGDELRGERACRGWTLRDAARELCIKPEMIAAIENADLSAFPNRSVITATSAPMRAISAWMPTKCTAASASRRALRARSSASA